MSLPQQPTPGRFARESNLLFIYVPPRYGWFVYKSNDRGRWTWFWDEYSRGLRAELMRVFGMRKGAAARFIVELAASEFGCRDEVLAAYIRHEAQRC
jgi:hypothetical protein